ncbi:hypothetical protein BG011_001714 [Mortierella polycephala]|uniref:Zincin n=1 Tax=Mortierella polycephala TaxID=41804 RepID=A0A9P6U5W3_9FUNG|nr:hypothetical protein BG011_001714 [Mortierella polycephala]
MLLFKTYSLIAIGAFLLVVQGAPSMAGNNAICTSAQCVVTAAGIIRDLDTDVDPCMDFSAYSCGGFWEREEIPADQSVFSYFNVLSNENARVIRAIVDPTNPKAPKAPASDIAAKNNIQKFQDLYASCMNTDQILKVGRKPVVDEVQKVLQVFPVTGSALASQQDGAAASLDKAALSMTLAHFNKMGLSTINILSVTTDFKDPSTNVLVLVEGGLGLPSKEYYLEDGIMGIYEKTVGEMFALIMDQDMINNGTETKTASVEVSAKWLEVAKDVVQFEKQLAAASTSATDLSDPMKTYNPSTVEQISAMTPSVDWSLVIQNTLPAGINNTRLINVYSTAFQKNLDSMLQSTAPKTLQYFFVWNIIKQLSGNIAPQYNQPLRDLEAALSGVSASVASDQWKSCVRVMNSNLGQMVGHYFVQESFKGDSRSRVVAMIESLRAMFLKSFPTLKWLDSTTLKGAIEKMKAIIAHVGFSTDSPDVASSKSLEEFYQGYSIDKADYFGNQLRSSVSSTDRTFKELNKPVNKKKLGMPPQTVNAFYSPTDNQIFFPAGILQPPFFHEGNPDYLNYGAIGVVVGHEYTHGFDNMGHQFDASGHFINWWTNATEKAFADKAKCFIEQYGNFTVKGPDGKDYNVNGELTLGENIADNGGLKQSFKAWQTQYKSDPSGRRFKNFRLPGLDNLTPEQLFFISYGRVWCKNQRPEAVIQQIRSDPHSPAKWRINGAVQNSVEFSQAFKCKANAPMNPTAKCDLW